MPAPTPTISIGMPVLNGAAHLEQAIRSIRQQSFTDFELIISDNGSSDATADIIARHAAEDPRLHPVRQSHNIGGLANFRYVLEAARGEYFMWAAYDDWHDPNYLECLHDALAADPDKQMAIPTVVRVIPDGSHAEITAIPDLSRRPRWQRVPRLLKRSRGGSIYSLFRRAAILDAYLRAERDFPYVWAADHLTILPFLVNDRAVSVAQTRFFNRDTGMSEDRYRPLSAGQLWPYLGRFLGFAMREILRSRLNPAEKAICLAYLPVYTNGKAIKWRRLLKQTVGAPFLRTEARELLK